MSTDDLAMKVKENMSLLKTALASPYGPFVFLVLVFLLFGKLSPDQFDQAVRLINEFNNPFGWILAGWGVLIYAQYAFFRPYLESEKSSVAATEGLKNLLQNFENVLKEFVNEMETFMKTSVVERRAQDERIHDMQTSLGEITGHLARLTKQMTDHEARCVEFRGEWRTWHNLLQALNKENGHLYPPCNPLRKDTS